MANRGTGQIITFYSFKGGTGRTLALANAAFLLACKGKKVCAIDWDLEAPGLHHYFRPFLADPQLLASAGVLDYVWDLTTAALTPSSSSGGLPEQVPVDVDIRNYVVSVNWDGFEEGGCLDFVPSGRQGDDYGRRTALFDWEGFYGRLGGGPSLEVARQTLKRDYDYVLIDSRTGVSDTSGICTIQLPDRLVACYTLNRQSIEGVARVLDKVTAEQRDRPITIFPLEMRVETNEKYRLEAARSVARPLFDEYLTTPKRAYWDDMEVLYWPFYAFEECLAVFADDTENRSRIALLGSMERLTAQIASLSEVTAPVVEREERIRVMREYALSKGELFDFAVPAPEVAEPSTSDPQEELWAEVEARFGAWERERRRHSLSAGLRASRYLLPQHLLNEAAKAQIPRRLVRNSDFMLFLSISRQKFTSRATALGALALWIAAVVGIASALLKPADYAWIAVAAGGVVVGMLGFAVYVGSAARGPQDPAPQHSVT